MIEYYNHKAHYAHYSDSSSVLVYNIVAQMGALRRTLRG